MRTRSIPVLVCLIAVMTVPLIARAQSAGNVVTDWTAMVQPSIHNPASPRSAGTSQILHTMVVLAMYDAAVAIEGGYEPYAAAIQAPLGADVRAAVATAAYLTARARVVAAEIAALDQRYLTYMAALPDGAGETGGIQVGQAASASILARRANDGFGLVVPYACSTTPPAPGEFTPDAGCPTAPTSPQPADAKVGMIQPFVIRDVSDLMPDGPDPMISSAYVEDFEETRDYGRIDSALRTAEQTDVAYFWSEHPYVHWNRNLVSLAVAQGLSVMETARFFAMVHTSASDAVIAGLSAKYYYRAWRPRTAIPLADLDGNPDTSADWRSATA